MKCQLIWGHCFCIVWHAPCQSGKKNVQQTTEENAGRVNVYWQTVELSCLPTRKLRELYEDEWPNSIIRCDCVCSFFRLNCVLCYWGKGLSQFQLSVHVETFVFGNRFNSKWHAFIKFQTNHGSWQRPQRRNKPLAISIVSFLLFLFCYATK